MSHEFRTPLKAIIGFSELIDRELMGPVEPEQYKSYIQNIHQSGERMLALVNDVLDIATIEAGKRSFDVRPFNVEECLTGCMRELEVAAAWKEIDIVLDVDDQVGEMASDECSVQQIIANLLSNAVKYTQPDGNVSISAGRSGDRIRFRIQDTGVGIPEKEISRLLEPFTRAISDPHVVSEGTGLGLSIVKSLVDELNGRFELESDVGIGTNVTVIIPDESVDA